MSGMFPVCILLVKGCQTLVMGITSLLQQSLVNTVPHTIMVHYDTYSGQGANWSLSFRPKSCLTFWPHIIDVRHDPSVYIACEGLPELGHGHNQPTATIIGEYSASYHNGNHWYLLLWSGRELILQTKILPNFLTTHHWCLACSQCVYCLWRVVRPWSWA